MEENESKTEIKIENRDTVKNDDEQKQKHLNIILKVVSVFCAIVLWFYVAGTDDKSYKAEINAVPVSIFTSEDLSVIQGTGATIDVTVSGTKSVIKNISADNITAYVDLSDVESAGRYTRTIDVTVSGIEGVSIVSKTPDNLSVYLDKTTSVSIPVEVRVYGYMLNDGYEMGEAYCDISSITVAGPEAELLGINCARAVVELNGTYLTKSMEVSAELQLMDSEGNRVSGSYLSIKGEKYVDVKIPVYLTKSLPLGVDYKYGYYNDDNVSIKLNPETITVTGIAETIEALDKIIITTIDEKKINSDTSARVALSLPDGVSCVDGTDSVSIKISHKGTSSKTVITSNYNIINPEGYDYEISTDYVGVFMRGPEALLNELTAADVTVSVDLSLVSSPSGAVQVPATIIIPDEYTGKVYEMGEYSLTVRFKN